MIVPKVREMKSYILDKWFNELPYSKTILDLIGSEEALSKAGRDENDDCIIR